MTRDEVLAMKPGPELSALVGEHVINECRHDFERCGPNFWNYQCRKCGMEDSNFVKKMHVVGEDKPYSTDISAAWEVVEKLLEKGDEMMGPDIFCYKNQTVVIIRRSAIKVHAKTAPEAICKAALLAVMEG